MRSASRRYAKVFSCKAGVRRAHLLDYTLSGALLLELYTFDGIGAMAGGDGRVGMFTAATPPPVHVERTHLKLTCIHFF